MSVAETLVIHRVMIEKFGGIDGIRDQVALESALSAPENSFHYEGFDGDFAAWTRLAGYYWFAISQNPPFLDGNKRTAFATADAFLTLNGLELSLTEDEATDIGLALAGKQFTREELLVRLQGFVKLAEKFG